MTLHRSTTRTRLLAGTAALVLTLGISACAEAEDAAGDAGAAAESVAGEAGEAAGSLASDASSAVSSVASEVTGAPEEPTEIQSADGAMVEVPAAVADAASDAGFSAPTSVETGPGGSTLATFPEGLIVHSADTGTHSVVGMIAETWMGEGGLNSAVGLPTGAEETLDNGWSQEFANGVISWVDDGTGNFSAQIQ